MPRLTIAEIKRLNKSAGHFFFSPDTMRFFDSKVLPTIYHGTGGVYFITSEQFHGSDGTSLPRCFTVRRFDLDTSHITTAGSHNVLTLVQARALAKTLAG